LTLEHLYHRFHENEQKGQLLFRETAEQLVSYRLAVRLRALLKDVDAYAQDLQSQITLQWIKYHNARLLHLEEKKAEAEQIYQEIAKQPADMLCTLIVSFWTKLCKVHPPQSFQRLFLIVCIRGRKGAICSISCIHGGRAAQLQTAIIKKVYRSSKKARAWKKLNK
jgi:hypothetical protein